MAEQAAQVELAPVGLQHAAQVGPSPGAKAWILMGVGVIGYMKRRCGWVMGVGIFGVFVDLNVLFKQHWCGVLRLAVKSKTALFAKPVFCVTPSTP
jgi:hypothetical protein